MKYYRRIAETIYHRAFIKLVVLLLISFANMAQRPGTATVAKETVSVNLSGRVFERSLPFDEPFNIDGAIPSTVDKIIFYYRAKNRADVNEYFRDPPQSVEVVDNLIIGKYDGKVIWDRFSTEERFLVGSIGPLRPNRPYEFRFDIFKNLH